jgi:hypothetical protein
LVREVLVREVLAREVLAALPESEVARRRAHQSTDEFGVAPVTSPRSPDVLEFFFTAAATSAAQARLE